ncbi:hypothetical protein [Bacillus aerolatus]|nr:hypothetical protein [Bacillus aerolatus]
MKDSKEQLSNTPSTAQQKTPKPEEKVQKTIPAHPDKNSTGAGGMSSPD